MPASGRHKYFSLQHEFFAVFRVILIKAVRAHLDEAVYIFVRIKAVGLKLYNRNGDVRAVIGDTLEIGDKVVKYEAVVERAYALCRRSI